MTTPIKKYLPFQYETEKSKKILSLETYDSSIFAGSQENGVLMKSYNGFSWENIFDTEDSAISALYRNGTDLFIGTSPNGKIYKMSILDNSLIYYGEFQGSIKGFSKIKDEVYCVSSSPSKVFKFNKDINTFNLFYAPFCKTINQVKTKGEILYILNETSDIIKFDGSNWKYEEINKNNLYSNIKNVDFGIEENIYAYDQDLLSVVTYTKQQGINSFDIDNGVYLFGSSNNCKVTARLTTENKIVFNTSGNKINDVLNLEKGVNLVSSDENLYLLYTYEKAKEIIPTNPVSNQTTKAQKNIVITYPTLNSAFEVGSVMEITWTSTKSFNDAIKISLYQGGKESLIINSNTPNNGAYAWDIPLYLTDMSDYQIYIEWLSAGTTTTDNKDLSDIFSIVTNLESSSSSSSFTNQQTNLISKYNYVNILSLEDEYISTMKTSDVYGVIFGTSNGRILSCEKVYFNAFLTGGRSIYVKSVNDNGLSSEIKNTNIIYALHNKIAEISTDSKILKSAIVDMSTIDYTNSIDAYFITPIINIKNDLEKWSQIIWTETKNSSTNQKIIIKFKCADSEQELLNSEWKYSNSSSLEGTNTIVFDISKYNLSNKFAQIMVYMNSNLSTYSSPSVSSITLSYYGKKSYYFYTTKFSLSSDAKNGILCTNTSIPNNTEATFGICNNNSTDWDSYEIIHPSKLTEIKDYKKIKVGIKFTSYDTSVFSSVNNFGIFIGSDSVKELMEEFYSSSSSIS